MTTMNESGFYGNTYEPGNGFTVKFNNGITVSIQWHTGAYAEVIDGLAKTVEIAAWNKDNNWWDFTKNKFDIPGNTHVSGWCNPEKIAEYLYSFSKKRNS